MKILQSYQHRGYLHKIIIILIILIIVVIAYA